jgi:hypothetical protein
MGSPSSFRLFLSLLIGSILCITSPGRADLWVSAYYSGYHQDDLPPSEIDFGAVSHVIHFALIPKADGTLDQATNVCRQQIAAISFITLA